MSRSKDPLGITAALKAIQAEGDANLKIITSSITATWSAIGDDVLESQPNIKNLAAIEACVDADRMDTFDGARGKQAHELLRQMYAMRGYVQTLRMLAKRISLN
jgi:hypothetical protein